jgi:tetratricopeptide (TPR) repeat protein
LGCLLWADKRPEEALRELTLAQELAPYQPLYHLNLAYYQEQLGNDTAARLEYAYIMATWPDLVQSSFWYAILGWPKSRQQVEILAKMAPQSLKPEALSPLKLIDLYLRLQDTKAARQVYDEYLAHAAADPVAKWLGQGKILLATARYEEARLEFEAAIQANPWLAEAYLSLSKIALAENKLIEAKQYAEAALFIERNPTAFYQSARVHEALGQPARAIEHYEAAFAQLTAFVEPELTRYATEVARRRPLPASHLPCLVRIYPTGLLVEITQAEGDLLEQQGAYEEAARLYRRLLDYEPTIEPIMTRLGRLYHLGLARQP